MGNDIGVLNQQPDSPVVLICRASLHPEDLPSSCLGGIDGRETERVSLVSDFGTQSASNH